MRFTISKPHSTTEAQLVYKTEDYAFDSEPRPTGCAYAVSVNEVELMIDEEQSRVVFVTGYCPYHSWRLARLTPPHSTRGMLHFVAEEGLIPGQTKKITSRESRWAVFVDPTNGWVCLGSHGDRGPAVEFAPGCIAVLHNDQLVAIWLHPDDLPADVKKQLPV